MSNGLQNQPLQWPPYDINMVYTGTEKGYNVCKRHGFFDTFFKQTNSAIYLHIMSMGSKREMLSNV